MKKRSRRDFLMNLGLAGGAILAGTGVAQAFPQFFGQGAKTPKKSGKSGNYEPIDFRYAPTFWHSTYCFPDDPYKNLVSKNGDLLFGYGAGPAVSPMKLSVGFADSPTGTYISQSLEDAAIPIITTRLQYPQWTLELVSFASQWMKEKRVDNLLIRITPNAGADTVECKPALHLIAERQFEVTNDKESDFERKFYGLLHKPGDEEKVFLAADGSLEAVSTGSGWSIQLQPGSATEAKPLTYLLRFPQEQQDGGRIQDGFLKVEELLNSVRSYWQAWKPVKSPVVWQANEEYAPFLNASIRGMMESRTQENRKLMFVTDPATPNTQSVVDMHYMIECACYAGFESEAREALFALWDHQNADGSFNLGMGEENWKETAAAVYALTREANLAQNWDALLELYTDAHKAIMYLRDRRDDAVKSGLQYGGFGLLPRGKSREDIPGVRSEYEHTIWAMLATSSLFQLAERFDFQRKLDLREFYRDLRVGFFNAARVHSPTHPEGFTYLSLEAGIDPGDEAAAGNALNPAVGQSYVAEAIFPGIFMAKDHEIIKGYVELMKLSLKESIPAGTGWSPHHPLVPSHAAVIAQALLWAGEAEAATKMFRGFLNHASPLYTWRQQQNLQGTGGETGNELLFNRAGADTVRYLRHMLILEDEKSLRLMDGVTDADIQLMKPLILEHSPTKWGKVTLRLEPVDAKLWTVNYKRVQYTPDERMPLAKIECPRKLSQNLAFDKVTGTTAVVDGGRVIIDAMNDSWEATFRVFR